MDAELGHLDRRAARAAGVVGKLVIERAGENACRRGLADPAHPGEDPGLRDAPGLERIGDRANHRILADEISKGCRPVFARQHAIAGRRRGLRSEARLR